MRSLVRIESSQQQNKGVVAMVADKFKDLEIVVRFNCILIYCPMICNGSKGGSNPPSLGSNPSGATIKIIFEYYGVEI